MRPRRAVRLLLRLTRSARPHAPRQEELARQLRVLRAQRLVLLPQRRAAATRLLQRGLQPVQLRLALVDLRSQPPPAPTSASRFFTFSSSARSRSRAAPTSRR